MSLKGFGGNISKVNSSKSTKSRTKQKKLDSEKSASKKSEVTRRKKRKAIRADLEIQAKDLLKKY